MESNMDGDVDINVDSAMHYNVDWPIRGISKSTGYDLKEDKIFEIWNISWRYIRHVLLSANKRPALKGLIIHDPSEASININW